MAQFPDDPVVVTLIPGDGIGPEVTAATLRLLEQAKSRGLLVGRGGHYGNVVRVAPGLVVSKAQIGDALDILDKSLAALG